jgi:hypothetical protein
VFPITGSDTGREQPGSSGSLWEIITTGFFAVKCQGINPSSGQNTTKSVALAMYNKARAVIT